MKFQSAIVLTFSPLAAAFAPSGKLKCIVTPPHTALSEYEMGVTFGQWRDI